MPGIRLERLTKVYDGEVLAVDDVTLEVADGEFMVLVGPSGCGKSTLLRMIAGLEKVTLGRVWIGDDDVTRLDPPDRDRWGEGRRRGTAARRRSSRPLHRSHPGPPARLGAWAGRARDRSSAGKRSLASVA